MLGSGEGNAGERLGRNRRRGMPQPRSPPSRGTEQVRTLHASHSSVLLPLRCSPLAVSLLRTLPCQNQRSSAPGVPQGSRLGG